MGLTPEKEFQSSIIYAILNLSGTYLIAISSAKVKILYSLVSYQC